MKKTNFKIGIGITTHNRYEVFKNALENIEKMSTGMPLGSKIVIVDDASTVPVEEATYRFEKNVGIAKAKNKCLELLDDCDHIFLFDDDTYPIAPDWYLPYIESPEPHLMYLFKDYKSRELNDCVLVYKDDKLKSYTNARGCMIYFDRKVLDIAGGMDISYYRWGYEHADLSNRIYNLGLTSFRFTDVVGSEKLIYSGDEYETVRTTVNFNERQKYLKDMKEQFLDSYKSKEYKRYKNYDVKNVVLTTYFTTLDDPQRKKTWDINHTSILPLIESTEKHGIDLVILNDCFDKENTDHTKYVRRSQGINPYFQRWLTYWQYLRDNPEIDFVFLVDATDVEMLKNPFPNMTKNMLYVGDETALVGCSWIRTTTVSSILEKFVEENSNLPLLNCGVVGGHREIVMQLCRDMYDFFIHFSPEEYTDMPVLNYILYGKYQKRFTHGRDITSIFKAHEEKSDAWFKHK